jgi:hypothetical protein
VTGLGHFWSPQRPKTELASLRVSEGKNIVVPWHLPHQGFFLVSNFVEGKAHGQGVTRLRRHPRQQPRAARTCWILVTLLSKALIPYHTKWVGGDSLFKSNGHDFQESGPNKKSKSLRNIKACPENGSHTHERNDRSFCGLESLANFLVYFAFFFEYTQEKKILQMFFLKNWNQMKWLQCNEKKLTNHVKELNPCPRGYCTQLQHMLLTYKPHVSLIIIGKSNGNNRKERLSRVQLVDIMEN